jgi:very-short-patch-repair endonuclease/transposase-like protein
MSSRKCQIHDFSSDKKHRIVQLYQSGMSIGQLMQDFNCTRQTVNEMLAEENVSIRQRGTYVRKPRVLDDSVETAIIARYQQRNATITEIASEFSLSARAITATLKSHGIEPKRRNGFTRFTADEKRIIASRYAAGETFEVLCGELGCHKRIIRMILAEHGVPIRSRGYAAGMVWDDTWRANHHRSTHTDEFRVRAGKNLAKFLRNMRSHTKDSPLEKALCDALRDAGICFIQHTKFYHSRRRWFEVDIELCQAPIIIEADGFLHQLSGRREQDKRRDMFIKSQGCTVFRFTGKEIISDANACIRRVITECGLVPDVCQIVL